jgi:hypothetical protein
MSEAGKARAIDRRRVMAKNSTSGGKTAPAAPRAGRSLVRLWHGLMKDLFDPYRPERHYMRGPGPKWHEKHAYAGAGR